MRTQSATQRENDPKSNVRRPVQRSRSTLPAWVVEFLPRNAQGVRDTLSLWLREHASELQLIGKETGHALAQTREGRLR